MFYLSTQKHLLVQGPILLEAPGPLSLSHDSVAKPSMTQKDNVRLFQKEIGIILNSLCSKFAIQHTTYSHQEISRLQAYKSQATTHIGIC